MGKKSGAFRPLWRLLDRGARLWMAVITGLRLSERMLLAGALVSFSSDRAKSAIAITIVLALLSALRAGARAPLLAAMRRRFVATVTQILLHRDAKGAVPNDGSAETDVVVFEGLWAAEDLAAERLPGIVADVIGAALIGGYLASTLPARTIGVGVVALVVAAIAADGARRISGTQAYRSWKTFLPVGASVEACIHGGLELVGNGRDREQRDLVRTKTEEWVRASWRADWLAGLSGRLPILLAFVAVMVAIVYAQSDMGVAPAAAFAQALVVASFLPPLASLVSNIVEVTRSTPKLDDMNQLFEDEGATRTTATEAPPALPAPVRWDSVSYAYPLGRAGRGALVLNGTSGEWRPGRLVGLAGPNGAGKSTIFRLLLGFDPPTSGTIVVGSRPLREIDVDAWRANIAYLSQRPFMPKGASVREAMLFLARDATPARMTAVLRRVGLWDRLIREAPEAPLDVAMTALSAGERQRVALARVLAQDAPLLLLDEPDANLDRAGVALLGSVLRELVERENKMVLFIAHDEELLGIADDVLRFSHGRDVTKPTLVSSGAHPH